VHPEQGRDTLLSRPTELPHRAAAVGPPALPEVRATLGQITASIAQRKADSVCAGVRLRLNELARPFELMPFDIDALLICLAPDNR
jgi:hypothetical protein